MKEIPLKKTNYKIRFLKIKSDQIFNYIEKRRGHEKRKAENRLATHMIKFFDDLEKSVLKDGFRNPIQTSVMSFTKYTTGFQNYLIGDKNKIERFRTELLPDKYRNKEIPIHVCNRTGGSRLWVGQKHNLEIPCIVCDFCEYFPDEHTCPSISCIKSHFVDKPKKISIAKNSISIYGLPRIV